jgi:hypothetical protein
MPPEPLNDPRYRPLAPTEEEIAAWAEREHKRRAAWLAGPTEEEKREWVRSHGLRARMGLAESDLPPSPEEADAWVERERGRRREWLAGPTEEEKREWARRQAGGLGRSLAELPLMQAGFLPEVAEQLFREAELAGKGYLYALASAPGSLWSYLLRAGRSFEQEFYQPPGRRRVRY